MSKPEKTQSRPRESQWNILKLLRWTTSYFKSHNIENPRADAEVLLANALNLKRIDLYLRYDQPLCNHELSLFKGFIKRRIDREPVAYIVGVKEFWSMELAVTRDVLIPRPETECLVEAALSYLPENSGRSPKRVLELGTGSVRSLLPWLLSDRRIFFCIRPLRKSDSDRQVERVTPSSGFGDSFFCRRLVFTVNSGYMFF